MKTKRFYVITVQNKKDLTARVSQEAYFDYEGAKRFIESRSDKPKQIIPFKFESALNIYLIHEVYANKEII